MNVPKSLINIYPNPSQNYIVISGIKDFDYEIFSVKGEKIRNGNYSNRINVSTFSPGIYFIKIGGQTIRFVKG
jgi:hypothetical protein